MDSRSIFTRSRWPRDVDMIRKLLNNAAMFFGHVDHQNIRVERLILCPFEGSDAFQNGLDAAI